MSAALAPAIEGSDALHRLPEVSRLAAHLATNVIQAQIEGQPVPDGHIRSLLDAALLLREYGVALPTLLGQIMAGVAEPEAEGATPPVSMPRAPEPRPAEDDDAGRLAWLLRPFQDAPG